MRKEVRQANLLLSLFGAVCAIFLILPMGPWVSSLKAWTAYLMIPVPAQSVRIAENVIGMPAAAHRLIQADMENRRLLEEVKQVAWLKWEVAFLQRENERLKHALRLSPMGGWEFLWAQIIQRSPMNRYRFLVVSAGEADGVHWNAPVLGQEEGRLGVVGRILEIGPHYAKVLLVTDELSSIAAVVGDSPWEGLLEGQGSRQLRLDYIPEQAPLAVGAPVHTSWVSPTFPPDLWVGNISKVLPKDPFLAFQSVEVAPAVQVESLREVMILKDK